MAIQKFLMVAALLAAPAWAQSARPPRQPAPANQRKVEKIKGLRPPLGVTEPELVQAILTDFSGGLVLVDEEAISYLGGKDFRRGLLRTQAPPGALGSALPPWMDSSCVMSGGTLIARNYPLGWGY